MIFRVDKISSIVLGKEIVKRCGTEGQHGNLSEDDQTTLKFMRAAISFISNAKKMCADLTNAAFIISQPGKEFIIQAGNGDWEFFFSEDAKDVVHGCCVRKGPKRFSRGIWKLFYFCLRIFWVVSWWCPSLKTAVRFTNGPLALTYEAQEPTFKVTLPEVTEEEARKNHS